MKLLKDFVSKYKLLGSAIICALIMTLIIIFSYIIFGKIITTLIIFILIFELCYLTIASLLY